MTHLPPDPPLNPHPRKAAPESVLAAPRNPVTRWNRKYLIAGATGLAGIVALGFYLGFGGAHAPQARPEAMTDAADTGQVQTPAISTRYAAGYADPALQARFLRVKAKLVGYLAEPSATLAAYPAWMTDAPARMARAYAFQQEALMDKALAETDALLAMDPDDPYALELEGQVLLESGKPREAIAPLRRATELTQNAPLIATTLGHALLATEDKANFAEAERVLKTAVARDRDNPFAWYQLGVVYEAQGDTPRARLASAEQQLGEMKLPDALQNAEAAEGALPKGSPDWLRAQDIAMSARAMIERARKSR